jgi:hypothetical protein
MRISKDACRQIIQIMSLSVGQGPHGQRAGKMQRHIATGHPHRRALIQMSAAGRANQKPPHSRTLAPLARVRVHGRHHR